MRKMILIMLVLVISTALFANFSLGLAFGEPSGLTGKYQFAPNFAVDFGAAYSFLWLLSGYTINADLLYLFPDTLNISGNYIPLYAGAGVSYFGIVGLAGLGGYSLRLRVPLGVYYPFSINNDFNIEAFFEFAPTIGVYPTSSFTVSACLGARYVF